MANYRLRGVQCSLVLDHLDSELAEMDEEAKRLYTEAELAGSKDVPEELKVKIGQLMEATAAKLLTYCMPVIPPLGVNPP
jgi:hypothetical protein